MTDEVKAILKAGAVIIIPLMIVIVIMYSKM